VGANFRIKLKHKEKATNDKFPRFTPPNPEKTKAQELEHYDRAH
jgi:hypothetical protein